MGAFTRAADGQSDTARRIAPDTSRSDFSAILLDTQDLKRRLDAQAAAVQASKDRRLQAEKTRFSTTVSVSGVPSAALAVLTQEKVHTFEDLSSAAGRRALASMPPATRSAVVRVAILSLLSNDPRLVSALARSQTNTPATIAQSPLQTVRRNGAGHLDSAQTARLQRKARALQNLLRLRARTRAAAQRNPSSLYTGARPIRATASSIPVDADLLGRVSERNSEAPELGERASWPSSHGPTDATQVEDGENESALITSHSATALAESLVECAADQSVFGPGVYVLHLLDFITKSYPAQLGSISSINSHFYQRFEDVPLAQGSEDAVGYAELSNRILENAISVANGRAPPNASISWSWSGLHSKPSAASAALRSQVYAEFSSPGFAAEPGFDASVLVKLFDSYVKEFNAARSDVSLALTNTTLAAHYAERRQLVPIDLAAMNVTDANVSLDALWTLSDRLQLYHKRQQDGALRAERIADLADSLRGVFLRALPARHKDVVGGMVALLVPTLPSTLSGDELEAQLLVLRNTAIQCVVSGVDCPAGSPYSSKPMTPLREFFRYFGSSDPDRAAGQSVESFADARLTAIRTEITQRQNAQLVSDAGGAASLSGTRLAELAAEAATYALQRMESEEEVERQLDLLARRLFTQRLTVPTTQQAHDTEVTRRATEAWRTAVTRAESGFHARIRHNLLVVLISTLARSATPPAFASETIDGRATLINGRSIDLLGDLLYLDLTVAESQATTPLAFAIGRLQTFVEAARLGTDTRVAAGPFDVDTWEWLRSYGTWHASMMVSVYPETFLIPEIRRGMTPQFEAVVDSLSAVPPRDLEQAFKLYADTVSSLGSIDVAAAIPIGESTLLIGHSSVDPQLYYSVLGTRSQWKSWRPLEGLRLERYQFLRVGLAPGEGRQDPLVYLFTFTRQVAEERMCGTNPCPTWKQVPRYSVLAWRGDSLRSASVPGWTELSDKALGARSSPELVRVLVYLRFVRGPEGWGDAFTINRVLNGLYSGGPEANPGIERMTFRFSRAGEFIEVTHDTATNFPTVPASTERIRAVVTDWSGTQVLWKVDSRLYHEVSGVRTVVPGSDGMWGSLASSAGFGLFGADGSGRSVLFYRKPDWKTTVFVERVGTTFTTVNTVTYAATAGSSWSTGTIHGGQMLTFGGTSVGTVGAAAYADVGRLEGAGSLTQPRLLALPTAWDQRMPVDLDMYQVTTPADPARVYLDELYLHLPMWVAERLRESGRHEDALRVLSRVYDPFGTTALERERYPAFNELSLDTRQVDQWLADPFAPFAIADLYKPIYLAAVKLAHVENILDWADRMFTRDSPESVARARELYEFAATIIRTNEWAATGAIGATAGTVGDVAGAASLTLDEAALLGLTPEVVEALSSVTVTSDIPDLPAMCMPTNVVLTLSRWRAESNLSKIRNGQNYAGMERKLQPYAVPVDPTKLVKQAAAGGIEFDETVPGSPPPIYRYQTLVQRARQLVTTALQFEQTMLASVEKEEALEYTVQRARQELALERGNVVLRNLNLQGAHKERALAAEQRGRAEFSRDHFASLLDAGTSAAEEKALSLMKWSLRVPSSVSVSYGTSGLNASVAFSPSGILQNWASMIATQATYDRRAQEWEYQRGLADRDVRLSEIGMDIAENHVAVAEQDQDIAQQRSEFARDNLELLTSRFTSTELYRWMGRQLGRMYREQLNMAIATAKAAQRALEFERQAPLDVIAFDYWDESRRGLLGAEKLQRDIENLEQLRLNTDQRKREIETTLSLASLAPVEMQHFRETGVVDFSTLMPWFDRQFPGHYLRLIKSVSVSLFALIPPNEGIKATLSNPGISRVMTGPPFAEETVVYRLPEAVALSSATNATGLFELRPDDPMLLPFEGNGVATSWRLELPKGANRFDFSTIADVLLKIRYTALEDRSFRQQVLAGMGQDEEGNVATEARRAFSVRENFPDDWYSLQNNPIGTGTNSRVRATDYLPNEVNRRISKVTVAVQWLDGVSPATAVPIEIGFTPEQGATAKVTVNLDKDKYVATVQDFNGKSPYGTFSIKVTGGPPDAIRMIDDILVVVDYKAKVHYPK